MTAAGAHRERQRRYRARQRGARLVVTLELDQAETAILVRLQALAEAQVEDRGAIAAALHGVLAAIEA